MKNIRIALLGTACALALGGPAAATPQNVVEVDAVDQVSGLHLGSYDAFHAAAYHCASRPCAADGGEGLFVKQGTTCSVDGGRILKDIDSNCFYRQNLNGDIRQFGVVVGSDFDCSPAAGGVSGANCKSITDTGATPPTPLTAMITAAQAAGLHRLTLAGLQLKTDHTVTIPDGMEFDLGGASPFASNDGILDIPGTLFLAHGTLVDMGNQTTVHNGVLLPDWFSEYPETIGEFYADRNAMVTNGDTGLRCYTKEGCIVHDLEVDGFDTAIEMRQASYNYLDKVGADGDVCFWASNTGGNVRWGSTHCIPKITRSVDGDNRQFLQFSAVAEETSGPHAGSCQATLTAALPAGINDGDYIWGAGAGTASGATNLNNRFTIYKVSSTVIDLVGSGCWDTQLYEKDPTDPGQEVNATWTAGDRRLHVDAIDHIQGNDEIEDVGGSTLDGLHVDGIWATKNIVILDQAPASSGMGVVRFYGNAFDSVHQTCNTSMGTGLCLELDSAARVDGGASFGGTKAGGAGHATGYLIGGPTRDHETGEGDDANDDLIAGLQSDQSQVFEHIIDYHIENANETKMLSAAADTKGVYEDTSRIFALVDEDSNNVSIIGGSNAKSGTALYVNLDDPDECLSYVAGNAAANSNFEAQFDVESGCLIADGLRPGGAKGYIADGASNVSFPGSYLATTDIFYEGDTGRGNTSTLGARLDGVGQNNLINGNAIAAPAPMSGTDLQVVPPDGQQGVVLQDAFGGYPSFTGRRANGTNASKTAVASGDTVAALEGSGYDGSAYTATPPGGLYLKACDTWSGSGTCTADVFVATNKGSTTPGEVARLESGNLGIGTGTGVAAPLEILRSGTSTTASSSMTNSATGNFDIASTTGFPSHGIMLIDNEAIAYDVVDSNTVNITARGQWGTSAASHANLDVVTFFTFIDGNSTTALPEFAVTSLGNIWWKGHTMSSGSAPTLGGNALGTGPSVVGNDNAGRITVGTSPSGTTVNVNFATSWLNPPVCFGIDETTTTVNPLAITNETKAQVQFKPAATPTAGDKISYACVGYK